MSEAVDPRPVQHPLRPILNKYIPYPPTVRQQAALCCYDLELLYGGAAGGGKSDWLLMCALQFAHLPDYSAVIFRRTFAQLSANDGLLPLAQSWLSATDAQGAETLNQYPTRWDFPSGAVLRFSHMQRDADRFNHQGSRYDCVCFDELGQFNESPYRYLFSRLRQKHGSRIPLRMRASANPGGDGHTWIQSRWDIPNRRIAEGDAPLRGMWRGPDGRLFLPARLEDNPHLDREQYTRSLDHLDPVTRAQLLEGDWSVRHLGGMIKRDWFVIVQEAPAGGRKVRYWDRAATVPKAGRDPDWTVGTLYSAHGSGDTERFFVEHVERFRDGPAETRNRIIAQAKIDGPRVPIVLELEGGSSGKSEFDTTRRMLSGFTVIADRPTGPKAARAGGCATAAQHGQVHLVAGPWVNAWLDEADSFPGELTGAHDDQIDSWSGAHREVSKAMSWSELNRTPAKRNGAEAGA